MEKLSHDHAQQIKQKDNQINLLKSNIKGLEKSLKAKTEKLQVVASQLNQQNQQHLSKTGAENYNSNQKITETNQPVTSDNSKPKRKRPRNRGKKKKRALAEQNKPEVVESQVESPEQNVSTSLC